MSDDEQNAPNNDGLHNINVLNDTDNRESNRRRINQHLIPLDSTLLTKPIMTRLQRITIAKLSYEDGMDDMNLNHIDLQIMRVIVPSSVNGTNSAYVYGNRNSRGSNNCSSNQVHYSRLFLMRIIGTESDKLCYVMETRNVNNSLWDRNVELKDNGTITIGTVVRVLAPLPIQNLMSGDIPMIETTFPIIVMKHPQGGFDSIPINYQVQGNNHLAFVLNNARLRVLRTSPQETTCAGLLCDKQRIHDWLSVRGCGCYHMSHR